MIEIRAILLAVLIAMPWAHAVMGSEAAPDPETTHTLSRYGKGIGPRFDSGVFHLLDGTGEQANTVGCFCEHKGLFRDIDLTCMLRVLPGAEGGFFGFLNTKEYSSSGPAPYLPRLESPSLKNSFALGIDVSNPPNKDYFRGPGNFYGHPEREVSLHWNGREIVKRRAEKEFRGGDFINWTVSIRYVIGGAFVTVQFADSKIYDQYFIPGMLPYEFRTAMGARTRKKATAFDVKDLKLTAAKNAAPGPGPVNFNIFNYVQTTKAKGSYSAKVSLPPENWAFGRVIMKIRIHGGSRWDEWDRCGNVSVETEDGRKLNIVRFITSYKTPCTWEVDVTDFRSLLAGKTRFFVHAGTIYKVTPGGTAMKAGLKAGDYLYAYDGIRLFSRDDVGKAKKQALTAGKKTVKLIIYRGVGKIEIDFPTGQMGISLGGR